MRTHAHFDWLHTFLVFYQCFYSLQFTTKFSYNTSVNVKFNKCCFRRSIFLSAENHFDISFTYIWSVKQILLFRIEEKDVHLYPGIGNVGILFIPPRENTTNCLYKTRKCCKKKQFVTKKMLHKNKISCLNCYGKENLETLDKCICWNMWVSSSKPI